MNELKIAGRYAKALFDFAKEKNIIESVKTDIMIISDVCRMSRDFILFLRTPVIKESKKVAVIRALFEGKIQETMLIFLNTITKNRRENLIPVIAKEFIEIYKAHKNIITAEITTATNLSNEVRDKIVGIIKKATRSEVELIHKTDDSIIGGFILAFKDKQYDASLLRQIQNLRQEFNINLYVKGF